MMKYNHEQDSDGVNSRQEEKIQYGSHVSENYSQNEDETDDFGLSLDEEDKEHLHQPSKYDMALRKYNTDLDDAVVAHKVEHIIAEKLAKNNTTDVKQLLFNCIDLTSLKVTDNEESILHLVERVNAFEDTYPDMKNVAAICTYPIFSALVSQSLEVEEVEVAAVSGGFPSSQTYTEVKIAETALALHEGATEIDIVLPVGKFLDGNYEEMCDEIEELKELCGEKKLKVILETSVLKNSSDIKKAAILAMYSGADFIKTSTGKDGAVATPEAVYAMCTAIKDYYTETERVVGIKVAGGVRTVRDALIYYSIVKDVLGKEWLNNKRFRIGASGLANVLLSNILNKETKFF